MEENEKKPVPAAPENIPAPVPDEAAKRSSRRWRRFLVLYAAVWLLFAALGCTVIPMDHFFLRPEQRTEARFAEPGGNVDRERFLSEVLLPLREGKTVDYRRFDCKTFTIAPPRRIEAGRLSIVEGAYAMHPDLAMHYDLTVFLSVSPEKQRERILVRNAPAQAKLFFERWIPFEQRYFSALSVPERCDLILSGDDQRSVP